MTTVYDFEATTIRGETISLNEYAGQVLLVVNTASKCGFTPQFKGLQELFEQYREQKFSVLGFPCNQFGGQEPGEGEEIEEFCQVNYGVSFPIFDKVDVNGLKAHPLFQYLVKEAPGFITDQIKWNFTKFLVDREGKVVKRYASVTTPAQIAKDIEKYI